MFTDLVWVDIAIPIIIAVSALFSLVRGFVREALSLAGWLAAFWVALNFAKNFADLFLGGISAPSLRIVLAFTILFVVTLLLAALINQLAGQLVKRTGLTGADRTIGVAFGFVRGVVVVSVLVLLAGMTTMPQDPWWKKSHLVGHFQQLAVWLQKSVAPEIADSLSSK